MNKPNRRTKTRSDAHDYDYPHVGHKINIHSDGRVEKGSRIFRVPCWREDCNGHSTRTTSTINRKRRNNKPIGCCIACSKYNPDWVRTCDWCEGEFYLPDSQLKDDQEKTFCCEECNSAWKRSEANQGENHHSWTGGNYDYSRTDAPEHRHWRERVFERDEYTCQRCGGRGVSLHAHHIVAYSISEDLEYVDSNGVALCEDCHKWVHRTENCGLKCDSAGFLLRNEVISESQFRRIEAAR